jgi:hypothetical protein
VPRGRAARQRAGAVEIAELGVPDDADVLRETGERRAELLVGHHGVQAQLLGDLAELAGRQPDVQQYGIGPQLARGDLPADRAAVVAAQQADARARPDAGRREPARDRIGPRRQLGEGERAGVVDDGRSVRVPRRPRRVAGRDRQAVAGEARGHPEQPVRADRPDHAGAGQRHDRPRRSDRLFRR